MADQPRSGQPMLDDVPHLFLPSLSLSLCPSPPILVDMPSELAAPAAAERDGRKGIHCDRDRCVTGMSSCPPISHFSSAESREERGRLRLPPLPQSGRLAGSRQLYNVRMSVGRRKWTLLVCSRHARPCPMPNPCPPAAEPTRTTCHSHTCRAPPPRSLSLSQFSHIVDIAAFIAPSVQRRAFASTRPRRPPLFSLNKVHGSLPSSLPIDLVYGLHHI